MDNGHMAPPPPPDKMTNGLKILPSRNFAGDNIEYPVPQKQEI